MTSSEIARPQAMAARPTQAPWCLRPWGALRLLVLCLGLAALPMRGQGAKGEDGAASIRQARIKLDHGVPRLLVNGQTVRPFILFFNTDSPPERMKFMEPQVRAAAHNNVHLYSIPLWNWPWIEEGEQGPGDFSGITSRLERVVKIDPQATFILRLYDLPPDNWKGNARIPQGDRILYADGTKGWPSLASAYTWTNFQRSLNRMIRQVEASAYGPRILAYHLDNGNEWFGPGYRESGADYSPANLQAFRAWLKRRYQTDHALATAWNKPGLTFATAEIPKATPGRFPIYNPAPGDILGAFYEPRHAKDWKVEAFYDPQRENDWVDFSRYTNEAVSQRVMDIAKLIKQATRGKKLTAFFFGYTFDLPSSINGHLDVERLLRCPEVDILISPFSYTDRLAGGSTGIMSAVDSITARGKLWINEDDTRTHLIEHKIMADEKGTIPPINTPSKDFAQTSNFLQRNMAAMLVHRTGTWWMDLMAAGAFNDVRLWQMLDQEGGRLYQEIYNDPAPYRPEVAVIIDPSALYHVKNDYDVQAGTLCWLRNVSAKTGAQTGYYYLNDFIEGTVPPCKAYVFANAFYLTERQVKAINKRLDRLKATAVWQYAPGYLGPQGVSIQQTSQLTGIELVVRDGRMESVGEGALQGLRWGGRTITPNEEIYRDLVSPRLTVADPQAETLGRYVEGQQVSTARKQVGRHTSVFIGDYRPSSALLKKIFQEAGVHIWTPGDEVVHTDGKFLLVHAAQAGVKAIELPAGARAEALGRGELKQVGNTLFVEFEAGESICFKVVR